MKRGTVFEGALEIIRRNVGCDGNHHIDDEGLHYAFVSALLKHPDTRLACINLKTILAKREPSTHDPRQARPRAADRSA